MTVALNVSITEQIAGNVYLDRDGITLRLAEMAGSIGSIPSFKSVRLMRTSARSLARKFAGAYKEQLGLDESLIYASLFFHFQTQICALLPLRHLARRLVAEAKGKTIFIQIPSLSVSYLDLWANNEMEPLFIYAEIIRRGGDACLVHQVNRREGSSIDIHFRPGDIWTVFAPREKNPACGIASRKAIVTSGMRGVDQILTELAPVHSIESIYSLQSFCETFLRELPRPPRFTIELRRDTSRAHKNPTFCSDEFESAHLFEHLYGALRNIIVRAARRAEQIVEDRDINEFHCCDHYFLESALIGHAVKKRGGKVTLWPHSANPCHFDMRKASEMDEIYCVTRSGAQLWKDRFPETTVNLRSQLILPPIISPRSGDAASPLSVVVLGAAHMLGKMPLLDYPKHAESHRRLFLGLKGLGDEVQVSFRPKPSYEDEQWLMSILNDGGVLRIEQQHPLLIDHPNMIFIAISFVSTALLEGMGRGIPAMVARDILVEDYVDVSASVIPIGPVPFIISEISRCTNAGYRDALIERQQKWYAAETGSTA